MSGLFSQWFDQLNKNVDDAVALLTGISKAQDNDPVSDDISNELTGSQDPVNYISPKNSKFFKGKNDRGMLVFNGADQDDMIIGSTKNDRIIGFNGNDIIKAGKGNDMIIGGGGNDILYGGDGKDCLIGGSGNDELIGGSDADTFYVNMGNNVIMDFDFSEGDCLKLGEYISNISYEQDGNNVLLRSDQGLTTILNNEVINFL